MNFPQPSLDPVPFLGTLKCGSAVDNCHEDAVWHILWRKDSNTNYTSLACDRHMEKYLRSCVFLGQHEANLNCDMPGSCWAGNHCIV